MYSYLINNLKNYYEKNGPIRIGIVGNGFIGGGILVEASSLEEQYFKPVVVIGRNIEKMDKLMSDCKGVYSYVCPQNDEEASDALLNNKILFSQDYKMLFTTKLDIILDCTGDPELGAEIAVEALKNKIHICVSPELDIIAGASLKKLSKKYDVVYSGFSGDEPGELQNLISYVKLAGFKIVAAGKFKNFMDHEANPKSVEPWSIKFKQNPYKLASFADGSKMNMEMGLVANAVGLKPDVQGMHCVKGNLDEISQLMALKEEGGILDSEGVIEIVCGTEPSGGVFVVGKTENDRLKEDLKYYKMGQGPNYMFYKFNHLCVFEMLIGAAKIVLFKEPVIASSETKAVDVATIAKVELQEGKLLDDIGGFDYYGAVTEIEHMNEQNLLPIAFARGLTLKQTIHVGESIRIDQVSDIPESILYRLWKGELDEIL